MVDEMFPSIEERVAVLESLAERHEKDANELFKIFRDHMDKEEQDQRQEIAMISNLDKKMAQMKAYFLGGAAVLSIVWAVATFIIAKYT